MSIQFVLGPSGSGKSTYLQKSIIDLACDKRDKKFLLIVPDQFNMQTQKEMILRHPQHAFSNIEVLSFSRLSHRILEEVGGEEIPVLDDTGKSLIIRHISEALIPSLGVMGSKIGRIGFVHEVKSAISEFMQYGIGPDDVQGLIDIAGDRKALAGKLKDLSLIYSSFMKYKADQYITKEETLDIVKTSLHNSELIKNSYIVFDGFTGFTPIQERVIEELMILAERVVFSFTMDEGCNPYSVGEEQELFWLSKRSVNRLKAIADKASVLEEEPVYITRRKGNAQDDTQDNALEIPNDLVHLEKNIFRYPFETYNEIPEHIHIYHSTNIREEITDTFWRINKLIADGDIKYRDIAIVTGDLGTYAEDCAQIAQAFDIPVYMDYSRSVMMSPFIEALRAAFDVVMYDFNSESVMRFLRTGFGRLTMEECDELENFLLRTGIRGVHSYGKVWTVNPAFGQEESEATRAERLQQAERINHYRETILETFSGLHKITTNNKADSTTTNNKADATARDYSTAIYELMARCGMYHRLMERSREFGSRGDRSKSSEYKQIYGKVIDLLDQIVALIGEESMTIKEYREILEAGFGEIKLGIIPQENDVVVVGDITRSRLKESKIIFFLGVNDCNIPGGVSSGGIISDLDREFLTANSDIELAPGPREQVFTQRLYLYMNMTKPTQELYVSYIQMDTQGKSVQPSYLITTLCKLFPELIKTSSSAERIISKRLCPASKHLIGQQYSEYIREYAAGHLSEADSEYMALLGDTLVRDNQGKLMADIHDAGFMHMQDNPLAHDIARKLYGQVINTSISRLEKFASCAYAHFLAYGVKIRERSEFGFERNDMGDVYHKVLEEFSLRLEAQNISWDEYSEELAQSIIDDILGEIMYTYGENVLISSARTIAMTKRLARILKRTVDSIQYQVKQGGFRPAYFEKPFYSSLEFQEGDEAIKMNINGKIDRIDVCESDGNKYIRIVDYKSGNKTFDTNDVFNGLGLQLAVYMKQALGIVEGSQAAGMLYYHIDDPMIENNCEVSDDVVSRAIHGALKMRGVVRDDDTIVALMDRNLAGHANLTSDVIPVGYTKTGAMTSGSDALSKEDFDLLLDYTEKELCKLTSKIVKGEIQPVPVAYSDKKLPCRYCDFNSICPRMTEAPGYDADILPNFKAEAVLDLMRDEMDRKEAE